MEIAGHGGPTPPANKRYHVLVGVLVAVVVVVGVRAVWVGVRPTEARNARDAVEWARQDPIWRSVPDGFEETGSYETFADADWSPRFSHESEFRSSGVGARFTPRISSAGDVVAWRSAAELAGWTYRGCSAADGGAPRLYFQRSDGPRGATLIIEDDGMGRGLVRIAVPATPGAPDLAAPAGVGRCSLEDQSTWDPSAQVEPLPSEPEPFFPEDPAAP